MKMTRYLLLFLFLTAATLSQSQHSDYTYTIHIGAFVKTQASDFNSIQPLGFLYAEQFDNSLLRVYMGNYPSESSANSVLERIKANGYPDAYVTRKALQNDSESYVIQLGTEPAGSNINWEKYLQTGQLNVQIDQQNAKILTAPFSSKDAAIKKLGVIRQGGFSDAFVKTVNTSLLHNITSFETGGIAISGPSEIFVAREVPSARPVEYSQAKKKESEPVVIAAEPSPTPPPAETIPESYNVEMTKKAPNQVAFALPIIRTKVKRNSAFELQKILKTEGVYDSGLDGYYGKGTKLGISKILAANTQLKKYKLLAQQFTQHENDLENWWPEVKLLNAIATDLNPTGKIDPEQVANFVSSRMQLMNTSKALSAPEARIAEDWHKSFIKGIDQWAKADPLHAKLSKPLRIAYFQSMVLLEDHFMDKKIKPRAARHLSAAVLKTIVEPQLGNLRIED